MNYYYIRKTENVLEVLSIPADDNITGRIICTAYDKNKKELWDNQSDLVYVDEIDNIKNSILPAMGYKQTALVVLLKASSLEGAYAEINEE